MAGVATAIDELCSRALIAPGSREALAGKRLTLTHRGCEVLERLVAARREHLADLASDWNPRREPDVEAYLKEAVRELVPDVRRAS